MYDPNDSQCDASNAFGTAASCECSADSSSLFPSHSATDDTWGSVSSWSSSDSFSSSDWSSSSNWD
jgi:hypothetical protein